MTQDRRFVHCPTPLPDEPLYGVVARHAAHLGLDNRAALSTALFGAAQLPSIDLPARLDAFAAATRASLGLSGSECLQRLTAFPYVARFLAPPAKGALVVALRARGGSVHNALGLSSSRVRPPRFLRVCPACVVEQRRAHGEAHWRRSHQLAGVRCCPDHGRWLADTSAPYRSQGSREYRDAEVEADDAIARADTSEPPAEHRRLARLCRDALWEAPRDRRLAAGLAALRSCCAASGGPEAVGRAFVAHSGLGLLEGCGCAINAADPANWFLNLLRRPRRGHHPLQHVLLEDFASAVGPSLRRTTAAPRRPRSHRPTSTRPEDVPDLRAKWSKALDDAPGRSRLAAIRACRPVYDRLSIVDRDWLFAEPPRGNGSPGNERRVDWGERDRTWTALVPPATRALLLRVPPARVTRSALVAEAGLTKGALSRLDRLPRFGRVLDEATESTDAFHVRLLTHAARQAPGAGRVELRARAKLTGPIGPLARQALACLARALPQA